jgi:FkbM family methyltransferase
MKNFLLNMIVSVIVRVLRSIEARLLCLARGPLLPNKHLEADTAQLKKMRTKKGEIQYFARPSFSDQVRAYEFSEDIYCQPGYLNDLLLKREPKLLIDIGANIGLSSLNLLKSFPTLSVVVGVEANHENWKVLKKNYEMWSQHYPGIEFHAIFGVADSKKNSSYKLSSLNGLSKELSASGTFTFTPDDSGENVAIPSILINEILDSYQPRPINGKIRGGVICKIDIEGGEEYLFAENTKWFSNLQYLTIEIHDRYSLEYMNSSRGILKALLDNDFAIYPQHDILHCYSRKNIKSGI